MDGLPAVDEKADYSGMRSLQELHAHGKSSGVAECCNVQAQDRSVCWSVELFCRDI